MLYHKFHWGLQGGAEILLGGGPHGPPFEPPLIRPKIFSRPGVHLHPPGYAYYARHCLV